MVFREIITVCCGSYKISKYTLRERVQDSVVIHNKNSGKQFLTTKIL
jgi:hypothetical protein